MKIFLVLLFIVSGCNQVPKDLNKKSVDEIIEADTLMSNMAAQQGFYKTLLAFADDSVIKSDNGTLPVIGKFALKKSWDGKKDLNTITWKPFKAEASSSGDLGYSIGYWKFATKDTTMYGSYYTIWKKQSDGKWKFVFDGGNNTPNPTIR